MRFGTLFKAFADNLCPAVVDAKADRLQIGGFSVFPEGTSDGAAHSEPRGKNARASSVRRDANSCRGSAADRDVAYLESELAGHLEVAAEEGGRPRP